MSGEQWKFWAENSGWWVIPFSFLSLPSPFPLDPPLSFTILFLPLRRESRGVTYQPYTKIPINQFGWNAWSGLATIPSEWVLHHAHISHVKSWSIQQNVFTQQSVLLINFSQTTPLSVSCTVIRIFFYFLYLFCSCAVKFEVPCDWSLHGSYWSNQRRLLIACLPPAAACIMDCDCMAMFDRYLHMLTCRGYFHALHR